MSSQAVQQATSFPPTRYPDLPIDPSREIRLVEILPGKDAIQCRLRKHTLDLEPFGQITQLAHINTDNAQQLKKVPAGRRFTALSYCWGGFDDHATAQVDDVERFPVSQNLHDALLRLRQENSLLWIDQICINQHDLHERNAQVALMGLIYNQATSLRVWLGEQLTTTLDASDNRRFRYRQDLHRANRLLSKADKVKYINNRQKIRALHDLCAERTSIWWQRTWVIQEWALPRTEGIFILGPHEFTFNDLKLALDWIPKAYSYPYTDTKWSAHSSSLRAVQDVRDSLWVENELKSLSDQSYSFADLGSIRATFCYDPRDKVYALLALFPGDHSYIRPDYGKPVELVYSEATRAAMLQTSSLSVLQLVTPPDHKSLALPSWVVDFSSSSGSGNDRTYFRAPFDARWGLKGSGMFCDRSVQYDRETKLEVQGRILDRIGGVLPGKFGHDTYLSNEQQACVTTMLNLIADVGDPYKHRDLKDPAIEPWASALAEQLSSLEFLPMSHVNEMFRAWAKRTESSISAIDSHARGPPTATSPFSWSEDAGSWIKYFHMYRSHEPTAATQSFLITNTGFLGLGSSYTRVGDWVVLLVGSRVPVILRPTDEGTFVFRGFAYVHGVMDLYWRTNLRKQMGLEARMFTLV